MEDDKFPDPFSPRTRRGKERDGPKERESSNARASETIAPDAEDFEEVYAEDEEGENEGGARRRRHSSVISIPLVERQIGSMALSEVEGAGSIALMRAVTWFNVLHRLGLSVPLVVVHDVGCVLTRIARPTATQRGLAEPRLAGGWRQLLAELADTEIARVSGAWKHRDAMVGIVLARVFSNVMPQLPDHAQRARSLQLPLERVMQGATDVRSAFARYDQEVAIAWLRTMVIHRLLPILELEQIDMDALRLLGIFRGDSQQLAGLELADLYNVIVNPALSDVIDFSLELMPSLLEVKREMGQQSFGMDGYASIERSGNLDSLMLSQLAFDDETFEQKFVNRELFYYAHEKQIETEKRSHFIFVDGSASMRGVREVFARGLGLALGKRLALIGERCEIAFFDSRVHESVKVTANGGGEVPYVLQFRAERGRNYSAVIRQIESMLGAEMRKRVQPAAYLVTHGQCQLPMAAVQSLSSAVPVHGIFILPPKGFSLPYLDLLHRVHVIDEQAIAHGKRASRAREIISAVESDIEAARSGQAWRKFSGSGGTSGPAGAGPGSSGRGGASGALGSAGGRGYGGNKGERE